MSRWNACWKALQILAGALQRQLPLLYISVWQNILHTARQTQIKNTLNVVLGERGDGIN